ncbi:MAG: FGGY-family carbohydrate kinase [Thermodesulfobacteriota bacterium]
MTAAEKFILAIDLGTSGSKTALVSVYGEVVDFEFQEVPLLLLPGGGAEQNPDDWWRAIMTTAKILLARGTVSPDQVVAVGLSCHWSGTVAVDRSGRPLMNAIMWMDSRGAAPLYKNVLQGWPRVVGYPARMLYDWIKITGGAPGHSGKDPLAHIHYIKENCPDIYDRTSKFLEPKEYVNLCLTGLIASSFDSITLHWVTDNRDLARVDYHPKLLRMAGLPREKLPDLKRAIDVLGPLKKEVASELGLRPDVQVVMGSPDLQCAAVGSGAVRDYEGHSYLGTSSWVSAHVPFKKVDIFHGIGSFPCALPDRYFIIDEQETAGKSLTWLRDNILYHQDELLQEECLPNVYQVLDRVVAGTKPGANGVIFTPWLYGERTPVEDNLIRASLINLSLENTRADLVRAIFEGVALNQKWSLGYVEKLMGRRMDVLNMVGGGANSDVWCQIFADVLDRTINQVQDPIQCNARGAAYIAAVGLGYIRFEDIHRHIRIKQVFKPNLDHRALYDGLFREFMEIYRRTRPICARLSKRAAAACGPPLK